MVIMIIARQSVINWWNKNMSYPGVFVGNGLLLAVAISEISLGEMLYL